MSKLCLAVTHSNISHQKYVDWIQSGDPSIEVITLSPIHECFRQLDRCHGVILMGGTDVHPRFYQNNRTDYPNPPRLGFIESHDEFEMAALKKALELKLPILVICRGMQLLNVLLGGDLIQDLEEAGKLNHRKEGEHDREHLVHVEKGTFLHQITHCESGIVNSAHHQALKTLSPELKVNCYSPDGVIEGVEWKNPEGKPWLMALQWHLERMRDQDTSPLSQNIRESFLKAAQEKLKK